MRPGAKRRDHQGWQRVTQRIGDAGLPYHLRYISELFPIYDADSRTSELSPIRWPTSYISLSLACELVLRHSLVASDPWIENPIGGPLKLAHRRMRGPRAVRYL